MYTAVKKMLITLFLAAVFVFTATGQTADSATAGQTVGVAAKPVTVSAFSGQIVGAVAKPATGQVAGQTPGRAATPTIVSTFSGQTVGAAAKPATGQVAGQTPGQAATPTIVSAFSGQIVGAAAKPVTVSAFSGQTVGSVAESITPQIAGLVTQQISGLVADQDEFYHRLCRAALELTKDRVTYDPAYYRIPYPGGDVPADRGVCTDVVIRAYRKVGIDLQKEVHEDMRANFSRYPKNWGLSVPDRNIDHRRVPNLMVFFTRHGEVLALSPDPSHYRPGDIVCWQLRDGVTHIGIVADKKNRSGERYQMVHNIGAGQVMEDCLFAYKIIGHYRYGGKKE